MVCRNVQIVVVLATLLVSSMNVAVADWPTYRGDARRGANVDESLPDSLTLRWTYQARWAPAPAWSGRDTRMPFDRVDHPIASSGTVFFGSSADDTIRAIDAATGDTRWTFTTGGPVRFAPVAWRDRLFATSDDGYLYCLAMANGELLWKFRGGPDHRRVLGNGRMISRWPARGGAAVADEIVYFAAGIWPSEGIYLHAIEAETGKPLWCNDRSGSISMGQPHGGANAASGISAQGYLVVADDVLLVPTGRAVPAAFRRSDGKFLYFHLQASNPYGGADVMATENVFFNGGAAFDRNSGKRLASIRPLSPTLSAAFPGGMVQAERNAIRVLNWADVEQADRKGNPISVRKLVPIVPAWTEQVPFAGSALARTKNAIISAGSGKKGFGVHVVQLETRETILSTSVDGEPLGLAVDAGRLFVATDRGVLHCFSAKKSAKKPGETLIEPRTIRDEPGRGSNSPAVDPAIPFSAQAILRQSGITDGYCIDLDCGNGALTCELAKRSNLHIVAVASNPEDVTRARRRLDDAGLYGVRASVIRANPAKTLIPDYVADLVVSQASVTARSDQVRSELLDEARRLSRPFGGVACLGKADAMKKIVRGPLEGAGNWTHQYADPANTNCSDDQLVRGPLGMLWFADLGLVMPNRHGRGHAPLLRNGWLFILGRDSLLCVNAYNGRKSWESPQPGIQAGLDGEHLMGTSGTGPRMCVTSAGLFIHHGRACQKIDPASGELLSTFPAPKESNGQPGTWGMIVAIGDRLYGTMADTEHRVTYRYGASDMRTQFTESKRLVAIDTQSGETQWTFTPKHRIRHNALAFGDERIYLIDRPSAIDDRTKDMRGKTPTEHPAGTLVALNSSDGSIAWQTNDDVFGTLLALSDEHDTLLMCYQDWRFKLASERGGRMAAFEASTGKRRWHVEGKYTTRPILNGRTIYLQPGAWDLVTGERKEFAFSRSYGCGILAGSRHMMVYRSATLGYHDLTVDRGTENYGGVRPGCWINTLPAGGLVLMPDATDRCRCSYLIKSSVALAPHGVRRRSVEEPQPKDEP